MKVGVISDTHISASQANLPKALLEKMRGVDFILHAGDLVVPGVLDGLRQIAPVAAVCGNMDRPEVREMLPEKRTIILEKVTLGLIHGWGAPSGLPERILGEFCGDVRVIVFGHSHRPYQKWVDQIYLFNPGSALKDSFSSVRSYGILHIEEDRVKGEIIRW